ncbi:glucosaminidase domain-containing protein [Candidatus Enterococcus ikei]|uniref:Glucosaminidase domain-containing protein n=1 Tax=Candidatus Enterococcus ikei TaxID=2815326 RepID=A0ABS3GUD3_9ENTE|nr:glucosaminidase domain-containing protein [Enterococcus sp. DIV0869a]MBO0438873.1 glucosaminidase domain-containing protein [Enterococcus sp. DIV0869a]
MKRKLLSLQMICVLLSVNLIPVISHADELTQSESSTVEEGTTETTGTSSTEETTPTTDSSTSETETGTTESTNTSTEPSEEVHPPANSHEEVPVAPQPSAPIETIPEQQPAAQPTVDHMPSETQLDQDIKVVKNEPTETFIRRIGEKARAVGQKNDLYASVMIAQAILETGSGNSDLSQQPYHNLFGIKGEYKGEKVVFSTQEDDGSGNWYTIDASFKKYPGYKESFEDYAKLMKEDIDSNKTIYSGTWKSNATSYREATKSLTGVYATDTSYDQKLNAFIEEYDLTEYDKEKPSTSTSGIIVTDSHPDSDFKEYTGETYSGSEAYAAGNCTQYVYNRIVQLDGYVETTMGNGMDWGATGKANGYEVSSKPKAGTAVSFQPTVAGADGTYGHVAFVEHVYEDGSILISEMNVAGLGVVSFRVIDKDTANTLAFVTPK